MGNVQNRTGGDASGQRWTTDNKYGCLKQTLGATLQLTDIMPQTLFLAMGGAVRDIELPLPEEGLWFRIIHAGGAFVATIKDITGVTTYGAFTTGEMAFCISDGVTWYVYVSVA